MSQEFIVVVKAPKNKLQHRVVSFIDIEMEEAPTGSNMEKMVNHKENRVVLKEQPVSQKIEVLLLGYLDNPVIKCQR